jgi:hypothetical protein
VFGVLIIGGGIVGGVAGPREKEDHSEEESLGASSLVVDHPGGQFGTDGPAVGH